MDILRKWYWQALFASVLGSGLVTIYFVLRDWITSISHADRKLNEIIILWLGGVVEGSEYYTQWQYQVLIFMRIALITVAPVLIAYWAVVKYLTLKNEPDYEIRCPNCRHILRGIAEPRCPECGWII